MAEVKIKVSTHDNDTTNIDMNLTGSTLEVTLGDNKVSADLSGLVPATFADRFINGGRFDESTQSLILVTSKEGEEDKEITIPMSKLLGPKFEVETIVDVKQLQQDYGNAAVYASPSITLEIGNNKTLGISKIGRIKGTNWTVFEWSDTPHQPQEIQYGKTHYANLEEAVRESVERRAAWSFDFALAFDKSVDEVYQAYLANPDATAMATVTATPNDYTGTKPEILEKLKEKLVAQVGDKQYPLDIPFEVKLSDIYKGTDYATFSIRVTNPEYPNTIAGDAKVKVEIPPVAVKVIETTSGVQLQVDDVPNSYDLSTISNVSWNNQVFDDGLTAEVTQTGNTSSYKFQSTNTVLSRAGSFNIKFEFGNYAVDTYVDAISDDGMATTFEGKFTALNDLFTPKG